MSMYKFLHPIDDIDRLYLSRKEGGSELANIEDCVDAKIQELKEYTKNKQKMTNYSC